MSRFQLYESLAPRQLAAIKRIVDNHLAAERSALKAAVGDSVRNLRLAKTVSRNGSYPATGNTFAIRFLECGFSPVAPGESSIACQDRTGEDDTNDGDDVIAREINGIYVPQGTLVAALWQRGVQGSPDTYGEWWIRAKAEPDPDPPCDMCTADVGEDPLPVTLTGAMDSYCDCDWINTTFWLTRNVSSSCLWEASGEQACGDAYSGIIQWRLTAEATLFSAAFGGTVGWKVLLRMNPKHATWLGNSVEWRWTQIGFSFDCTATRNLSVYGINVIGPWQACTPYGWTYSTCQVN